jgi:hypothetical protein
MRQTVTIHHPETGATSTVAPQSVPSWQRAGWTTEPRQRKRRNPETPAALPVTPDAGASMTEEE